VGLRREARRVAGCASIGEARSHPRRGKTGCASLTAAREPSHAVARPAGWRGGALSFGALGSGTAWFLIGAIASLLELHPCWKRMLPLMAF
jgi:hypothetical protein